MRRAACVLFACGLVLGAVQPAAAQQQTVNFTFGYFTVRGEDARGSGDILNENLNVLRFEVADFNSGAVGAEWLIGLGEYLEAGAGLSFSRRTVPSVYGDFVDTDGSEIEQSLRLRMVPVALTVRVLPLGQSAAFQPYVGAGLAVIGWRYSESGEFIDFRDRSIFRQQYVASGSATGPLALGGIRFGGDTLSAGAEIRYQGADADLGAAFASSAADRVDLGGWSYLFSVGYRFGR